MREEIREIIDNMNADEQVAIHNRYCDEVGYSDDEIFSMDEINEWLAGKDPDEILRQMEVGVPDECRQHVLTITDRRQAIRTACQRAQRGDVVLVAGKGHEDYQEIRGVKHHFDDREQVLEVFAGES